MHKRSWLVAGFLATGLGVGVLACQEAVKSTASQSIRKEDITAEHYKMPPLARTRLSLEGSFSRQKEVFTVEIADTPQAKERGLMWRSTLGVREGMLFDFGQESEHAFWMKNTLIGLDLVFISEAKTVVGILEQATPLSTELLSIGLPSRYVLELPAGTCAKLGIRTGSRVDFNTAHVL